MFYPFDFSVCLRMHASGSMARLKRRHKRGSSCYTPLVTWNGVIDEYPVYGYLGMSIFV
jgi:hypothetical protein